MRLTRLLIKLKPDKTNISIRCLVNEGFKSLTIFKLKVQLLRPFLYFSLR
jgi:hypothetical protein